MTGVNREKESEFIVAMTRGPGEKESHTAREELDFLCWGSPTARFTDRHLLRASNLHKLPWPSL